ncbi:MAG: PIN domain-containing protein [Candidatus Eremiobacteraeota bacterium]|nr:PIN domain-containing protein [Candidatus Eremiobacteraeota bacterium]MCW5872072.1 PIN domain-containing protein [Candidatus Eremiobacteraeota bacterium]
MIYLDTSVALAHLLAENRRPPLSLWNETLVSSRLLEYELWTRIHARGLEASHGEATRQLVARVALVEMVGPVLSRALQPFPLPVRTLDGLHLATMDFLHRQGQVIELASYDDRLAEAARAIGFASASC